MNEAERRRYEAMVEWITCPKCGRKMDKFYLKLHQQDSCWTDDMPDDPEAYYNERAERMP